jgi:hypothetical protein
MQSIAGEERIAQESRFRIQLWSDEGGNIRKDYQPGGRSIVVHHLHLLSLDATATDHEHRRMRDNDKKAQINAHHQSLTLAGLVGRHDWLPYT